MSRRCTTHHHACACREKQFADKLEAARRALDWILVRSKMEGPENHYAVKVAAVAAEALDEIEAK